MNERNVIKAYVGDVEVLNATISKEKTADLVGHLKAEGVTRIEVFFKDKFMLIDVECWREVHIEKAPGCWVVINDKYLNERYHIFG